VNSIKKYSLGTPAEKKAPASAGSRSAVMPVAIALILSVASAEGVIVV
jgi:hypothetical protein